MKTTKIKISAQFASNFSEATPPDNKDELLEMMRLVFAQTLVVVHKANYQTIECIADCWLEFESAIDFKAWKAGLYALLAHLKTIRSSASPEEKLLLDIEIDELEGTAAWISKNQNTTSLYEPQNAMSNFRVHE